MTNSSGAVLARIWILGLATAVCLGASGSSAAQTNAPCCAKDESTSAKLSEKSLYQVESTWTTDKGTQIKLADLQGRPQVLVMFFASCQSACPILVHDLKRIETALKPDQRARVGFTLVTIDPRRDTPEALAKYRATQSLPSETWSLLQGEPEDIRELAVLLGLKYKEQANGQFSHSNLITVLNQKGEIVHQLVGLGQDIKGTVKALNRLMPPGTVQAALKPGK